MRSKLGDVFILAERVRMLPVQVEKGVDLEAGEIVISTGEIYDQDNEIIYITRFGLGTLPEDDTFHNFESRKL